MHLSHSNSGDYGSLQSESVLCLKKSATSHKMENVLTSMMAVSGNKRILAYLPAKELDNGTIIWSRKMFW